MNYLRMARVEGNPHAEITRGSEWAAGYDLRTTFPLVLPPHGRQKIPTGIAVEIPPGYVGLIRDRSSLGGNGIIISGGVIDSDYRGEIIVCLNNLADMPHSFNAGDRIAQLVVVPCLQTAPVLVSFLSETKRGEGGFGSTGK
jgi:dUTP pyrophosphatase